MKNYAVFLEGSNFTRPSDGLGNLQGFFVTIRVEANTDEEATNQAIRIVKADPEIVGASSEHEGVIPTIQAKVVHELLPGNKMKNTGYIFFPMEKE